MQQNVPLKQIKVAKLANIWEYRINISFDYQGFNVFASNIHKMNWLSAFKF